MKKTIRNTILIVLAMAMVSVASIAGTMAWLQDTDGAVNVMTLGNVYIEQHEYQRVVNADGTYATATIDNQTSYVLENFEQGKPLLPIVGDPSSPVGYPHAGYDATRVRMTQVGSYGTMDVFAGKNAVDKFVTVENTGSTDAYVRTLVAVEAGSTDGSLVAWSARADKTHDGSAPWLSTAIGMIEIDGNNFMVVEYLYLGAKLSDGSWRHENGVLSGGDTTYPNLSQVYIKSEAGNEDCEALDGNNNGTLDILVLSQAVQAAGFDSAAEALDSAFGKSADNVADWFGGENIPVTVTSFDDMKAALDAGETDVVVKGAAITENPFNGRYYKDRNIDFVDCTFTANMNYMYINNATFTNCTFDCGSANAAVHYDELFGDLVFNNCTFVSGKIQIGANKEVTGTVTFNDCEFAETASTSIWSEKGIRVYSPAEFNNCEFNNRVVMAGANGLSIAFNSCTMNGGSPVYYVDNTDGIIRGGNVPSVSVTN